jgi:transcriptional regulator with XRE-family HTH domain
MAVLIPIGMTVNSHDDQFFKALGSRIASARRARNLTQQEVADQLGIAQQTYAHYEVGRVRFPASTLPLLAQVLGVTTEELLGHKANPKKLKRGPVSKLDQQIERLRKLPKTTQQVVMKMLDGVLAQTGH